MATKKSFVIKKKRDGYEKFGDSLSDTEIEVRRNMEEGDSTQGSIKEPAEKFATGDGFLIAPPKPERVPKAFGLQMSVKNEMKIDLRQPASASSSKQSSIYKLYPIEEVSERSMSTKESTPNINQDKIKKLLEDNRERAKNRPLSANRARRMDKDFEIRKAYFTSDESEMNSAFNEQKAEEVAKVISASQHSRSETTQSDSMSSFKRAHIQRLSHDSMQRYQSRLLRFDEDCSNQAMPSSYTDDDLMTVRTYSTTKCNPCCFGKFFKKIRKPKNN